MGASDSIPFRQRGDLNKMSGCWAAVDFIRNHISWGCIPVPPLFFFFFFTANGTYGVYRHIYGRIDGWTFKQTGRING